MNSNRETKVLVIDDEAPIREVLMASLKDEGFEVDSAQDGQSGLEAIEKFRPHVVLLDIWMPGKLDGIDVLSQARRQYPAIEFVIMSGHGTIETAVKATKLGAWDFAEKPLSMDRVLILISNIRSYQSEKNEKAILLNRLRKNISIVGESEAIVNTKQLIARLAPLESWILIKGNKGTGKELIAENIHYLSKRSGKSFVTVNVSSIPEDLIDSELFGFEKGAFTGAASSKKGKVDLAHGGTLYLDEVADLSLKAQTQLLKLMQDQRIERVGGSESINVDVRVIAATSKNLEEAVRAGQFREDLYNRLSSASILLTDLKERASDLPALLDHFSEHFAKEGGRKIKSFNEESLRLLQKHDWHGNVREVKNFVERLYILTDTPVIEPEHLSLAGLNVSLDHLDHDEAMESPTFKAARAIFEKEYIRRKLNENNGNISKTAEVIGLERSHLHRKIKSYGIENANDRQ